MHRWSPFLLGNFLFLNLCSGNSTRSIQFRVNEYADDQHTGNRAETGGRLDPGRVSTEKAAHPRRREEIRSAIRQSPDRQNFVLKFWLYFMKKWIFFHRKAPVTKWLWISSNGKRPRWRGNELVKTRPLRTLFVLLWSFIRKLTGPSPIERVLKVNTKHERISTPNKYKLFSFTKDTEFFSIKNKFFFKKTIFFEKNKKIFKNTIFFYKRHRIFFKKKNFFFKKRTIFQKKNKFFFQKNAVF